MPTTRDFEHTVTARVRRDREFRAALLAEAAELLRNGEAATANAILRNYLEVAAR